MGIDLIICAYFIDCFIYIFILMKTFKHPIYSNYSEDVVIKLLTQNYCEIDYEFPGFVDIYESLSKIIPHHFTIMDFGCYIAPQCYYFKDHKKYIGIDHITLDRFYVQNTIHIISDISVYINQFNGNVSDIFAICSYVPGNNSEFVRSKFTNCFCYYPSHLTTIGV